MTLVILMSMNEKVFLNTIAAVMMWGQGVV